MLRKILVTISLLTFVLGQVPGAAMQCVCTGKTTFGTPVPMQDCPQQPKPEPKPKCSKCKPPAEAKKPNKACYVSVRDDAPQAVAQAFTVDFPALILPGEQGEFLAQYLPELAPKPHLLLPRIREPDIGFHHLRAPPRLV